MEGIDGDVEAMPDTEILAQKLYYRAAGFSGRDLYDFAAVTRLRPTILDDPDLRSIARARSDALEASLASPSCRAAYAHIVRPRFAIPFDTAKAALVQWIAGTP